MLLLLSVCDHILHQFKQDVVFRSVVEMTPFCFQMGIQLRFVLPHGSLESQMTSYRAL